MDKYQIIEKPLVTEKGSDMLAGGNWVVFRVHLAANKIQAGTIAAKLHVGGETKVLIDGENSRIVISD